MNGSYLLGIIGVVLFGIGAVLLLTVVRKGRSQTSIFGDDQARINGDILEIISGNGAFACMLLFFGLGLAFSYFLATSPLGYVLMVFSAMIALGLLLGAMYVHKRS